MDNKSPWEWTRCEMRAEILDTGQRFAIEPVSRPDGSFGPPCYLVLSLRPCWRKPPVRYELVFMYESEDLAYYGVKQGV